MLYFCALCLHFERRLCWQLSSIAEQINAPEMRIEVAGCEGEMKKLDRIAEHFGGRHGLNIRAISYNVDTFAKRGLVRNQQILNAKKSGAEWIFFADCDVIYAPDFFKCLNMYLDRMTKGVTNCIAAACKQHVSKYAVEKVLEQMGRTLFIDGSYATAQRLRPQIGRKCVNQAGGGMQVCRIADIDRKNCGLYVDPAENKDRHLFDFGQRAWSDKQFRKAMGGSTMINLPPEIHLQHSRDKEVGYHIVNER